MEEIKRPVVELSNKREFNWFKVMFNLQTTITAVFVVGVILKNGCMWKTIIFSLFVPLLGLLGETAGAHRLWAHRSYKAYPSLRVFLMLCQTIVGNGTIYKWVQLHRLHHKYHKTNLDPYYSKKGFLYSQFINLTEDLSPAQNNAMEKEIDMSDLEQDQVVMFQKTWYPLLYFIFVFLLPINAPAEYWGETLLMSALVAGCLRYFISLQLSALINTAYIIWDLQPGEKYPADSNLVFIITKTYWISYHYLAPWDYQTSEFGKYGTDCISYFIRVCAALNLAYDLQTVDSQSVRAALTKSLVENRNITECLLEVSKNNKFLNEEHYLEPVKHY